MKEHRRRVSSLWLRRRLLRRLRHGFMVGSGIVALMYAIDPEWPLHLRRLVVVIQTIFGRSNGFVVRLVLLLGASLSAIRGKH